MSDKTPTRFPNLPDPFIVVLMIVAGWFFSALLVMQIRHPELTQMQVLLHLPEALFYQDIK